MQPMETCKGHNQVSVIANETDKSNYLTYSVHLKNEKRYLMVLKQNKCVE